MSRVLALIVVSMGCAAHPASDDEASESGSSESESDSSSTESGESTDDGEDPLPPAPLLESPADGALELPLWTTLCWQPVDDPGDEIRYRVWVDDVELTAGMLGEQGYEGPCVGPLLFDYERTYEWHVLAYEVDDPSRTSPSSETWSFSTLDDGIAETVFEDDFSEDLGWEIVGEDGAWVRGDPEATTLAGVTAQPGLCWGGDDCLFTGHNPGGDPQDADVESGSTSATSPAFDLEGAATATVRLVRFFHGPADATFLVELLVPDDRGELVAHPLELLDASAPLWTPMQWAACGVPMRAGSRIRVTASNAGADVVEAAIDSVVVEAHELPTVCEAGLGGICDPEAGDAACPNDLICCTQGAVDRGVHRCEAAVAGLDFESPPLAQHDPGNGPLGCHAPDVIVDVQWLEAAFNDIFISDDTCELLEGCVGTTGWRRIMRFTVATPNIGSDDMALGVPANDPDLFHYSGCHDHYHFDEFARYQLLDGADLVATGHKQAFCLLDTISWAWPLALPQFDCGNQGITRGFSDFYESGLPCQWVDVTEVAPGDYTLRISLNGARPDHARPILVERDHGNNIVEVQVTIPPP